MNQDELEQIKAAIGIPLDNPHFFTVAYAFATEKRALAQRKDPDNLKRVCAEEYEPLTRRFEQSDLQDSSAVRNVLRSRRLANLLIDDKGMLNKGALKRVIELLEEHTYFLGPDRQEDSGRQEHILKVLKLLDERKDLVFALQSITRPHMHKYADQIIADTLQLPPKTPLTNAHARRAALSAWLTTLRQSLGSCFATAPAILVHDELPVLFLTDINQLLSIGQLKRTFGGIEYAVPLSLGWGLGDLKKFFSLSGNAEKDASVLSSHPGFLAALEEEAIIPFDAPLSTKLMQAQKILESLLPQGKEVLEQPMMTAEGLLQLILLRKFKLTFSDLEDFLQRPRNMIQSNLLLQVPSSGTKSGGKGQACANYLIAIERAKNAFKAMADNALLKAWEFTLASFAETKADFAKWNFYSSLGLNAEEKGGIGQCLYEIIKKSVDIQNERVLQFEADYERLYYELKTLESRFRGATEQESKWIRIEYQAKTAEFNNFQEDRDRAHRLAKRMATLYEQLINFYVELFPKYFQEVYDPEMLDLTGNPYDDSPAGFRLLFKHGRSNTSQWTLIYQPQEFIQSLSTFFTMAEREMDMQTKFKGMQKEISDITSALISHVRTDFFLETAFERMARTHQQPLVQNPLDNLDKISAKPWAYIAGGSLDNLISCYFKHEDKPMQASRWVESPEELLVFIIDTLKQIPYSQMEVFEKNPHTSLLMHSPTHAFLLKPGLCLLKQAWKSQDFTYTWVRDQLIIPLERAVDSALLNDEMMDFLVNRLMEIIPGHYKPRFKDQFSGMKGSMSAKFFREHVLDHMRYDPGMQYRGVPVLPPSAIDSVLYLYLPLFPSYQLRERLAAIFELLPGLAKDTKTNVLHVFDALSPSMYRESMMGAKNLQDTCKSLLCLASSKTSFPLDYHSAILDICRSEGFALPRPVVFADTNWARDNFAFVINPGSSKLDLWKVNRFGSEGEPMISWRRWLDGTQRHPEWGIYYNRKEYT